MKIKWKLIKPYHHGYSLRTPTFHIHIYRPTSIDVFFQKQIHCELYTSPKQLRKYFRDNYFKKEQK